MTSAPDAHRRGIPAVLTVLAVDTLKRLGSQQPSPILLTAEQVLRGQLSQSQGDRRSARPNQPTDGLVREWQVDRDAIGADAAPSIREVPEECQQAVLDPGELRDRLVLTGTIQPS